MGLLVQCDRCGRTVQNMPLSKLKSMTQTEIICKECKDMEANLENAFRKLKEKYIKEHQAIQDKFTKEELPNIMKDLFKKEE